MIGRLQPLTVQRQELSVLTAERDKLDEKETQTVREIIFCKAVDDARDTLRDLSSYERIGRDDIEYLSYHIETAERKLYEAQNNP